jgi:holo-[acyl-carrier protein] synthase
MNLSSGIDLIEIERVREAIERHGDKFIARIFTEYEQKECKGRIPSLAARFAAKEAVAKALGTGIGDVSWLDIEIRGDENNAPRLYLYGMADAKAKEKGLSNWSVSLTHTESQAMALVVVMGDQN